MTLQWPEDDPAASHQRSTRRRNLFDPLLISPELAGDYDRERRHAREYVLPVIVFVAVLVILGLGPAAHRVRSRAFFRLYPRDRGPARRGEQVRGDLMPALEDRDADAWNRLAEPWRNAFEEAWAAWCAGSLPIGAVVADARGLIIARGRNGIFGAASAESQPTLGGHILAHAEFVALLQIDYRSVDLRGCVLYTTLEPCPLCIGAIRMMPIRELHYAAHDPAGGSVALLEATEFMRWVPVHAVHAQHPLLETLSLALNVAAHLRRADGRGHRAFLRWEQQSPQAFEFGRHLAEEGTLDDLRASGATAAEMVRIVGSEWQRKLPGGVRTTAEG